MIALGLALLAGSAAVALTAYAVYPIALWIATRPGRVRATPTEPAASPGDPPMVSITLPAYNEEVGITDALERILELDYPAHRLQVIVVSDASTDRTDELVRRFAPRGVELVRLPRRLGKTAAENAARSVTHGDIVVNTDASVRIAREALRPLVAAFQDPTVGVASGRDVSVTRLGGDANVGESGYVGYEMWVRGLETAAGGIVGASGCLYASLRSLPLHAVPDELSRDFAAPLIAREKGYRTVSVADAVCHVPRTASLRREYRRKVRTMARGLQTLFYKRHLLNPLRYGRFAVMLLFHKLIRWLTPVAAIMGLAGLGVAALAGAGWARVGLAAAGVVVGLALVAWYWPEVRPLPRWLAIPAYVCWGLVAGLRAWWQALRGERNAAWEPTRRDAVAP